MRIFDCVILSHWGEMGLLEKRFLAYKGHPEVTHVICERKPGCFLGSALADAWRGRWNHVGVEADEGDLRDHLSEGCNGEPDDMVLVSDMRTIPEIPRQAY